MSFLGTSETEKKLTMNIPQDMCMQYNSSKIEEVKGFFKTLNGNVEVLICCDTLQVNDYSKFNMAGFDEEHKKFMRKTQFPKDLEAAYQLGVRLAK